MQWKYLSRVQLGELEAAAAVARTLSFRAAAEALRIAQPSVSRKVAHLEDTLGCRLFERDRVSVQLTPAGRMLTDRLPELFQALEQCLSESADAGHGITGTVRIGFSEAAMSSFLPPLLRAVKRACTGCSLELTEAASNEVAEGVRTRRFDAGFALARPRDPELDVTPLPSEPVGVVLPDDHPLAERSVLGLADLRDEAFILFPRPVNPHLYDRMIVCCAEFGFSPRVALEVTPRSKAIAMAAAGEGIATIPERLRHQCLPGTVYRRLAPPAPEIEFSMLVRTETRAEWLEVMHRHVAALWADSADGAQ
ncbi:LysR family transcriptional regulator [Thiohalorhabdus methylotrophus]|uniref:LysR family transcriptional regulator n=1 Tax=Thiohalorhabdus methylotrophus TaxID=3242694 RepID=A0ABV4U0N2_9GAMM